MEEAMEKVENEATATSEFDALKLENEKLRGELKFVDEKIFEMEKAIVARDEEIDSLKQSLEGSETNLSEATRSLTEAVAAYKELAAQANPGPVAEMIKGGTVEEIKESVAGARALVEKVKQEIGAENARMSVPAGAPQRTSPDLSTLSPREKIIYGMEG